MPKYNADLLEEFERHVPIGIKAKDIKQIQLDAPNSHQ
jgi:hypothetical protein